MDDATRRTLLSLHAQLHATLRLVSPTQPDLRRSLIGSLRATERELRLPQTLLPQGAARRGSSRGPRDGD